MPKQAKSRTTRYFETLTRPGNHSDGRGLYLRIAPGRRSWVLRYTMDGKLRYMGLGPFPDVSLAEARQNAENARRQVRD
jgi:hypothetical protein